MNIEELIKANQKLKEELEQTREHLKKYTAPIRNKLYYEENKELHKQRVKEYKEKINYTSSLSKEKKKEYARQAYLNKKTKINNIVEKENI
jgi:uncharacterized protein (DUF169 family)